MKWILLVLLAVNLSLGGYFYWQSTQPEVAAEMSSGGAQLNNLALSSSQLTRLNTTTPVEPVAKQPVNEQCIRITGLIEGDSLPVVESRLRALEVVSTQETSKQVIKQDFQVLQGPFASLEEARSKLGEITARDIEGYVITSGPNANSLSLGVFSNQDNANRKIAELKAANVEANIVTKDHFTETIILQIDRSSARLISDQTLQSMLSSFEDADFLRYNCN